MTAEKNEEKIENNSTKNEKTCDDKNELLFTNQFVFIRVAAGSGFGQKIQLDPTLELDNPRTVRP